MHYANGREAKVGDQVVGRCYNTTGIVAGTLVSLTPGQDACSAQVEFLAVVPPGKAQPRMHVATEFARIQKTQQHGTSGPEAAVYLCRDYTECKYLVHAEEALAAGAAPARVVELGARVAQLEAELAEERSFCTVIVDGTPLEPGQVLVAGATTGVAFPQE